MGRLVLFRPKFGQMLPYFHGITLSRPTAVEAVWDRCLYGYVSEFC